MKTALSLAKTNKSYYLTSLEIDTEGKIATVADQITFIRYYTLKLNRWLQHH